MFISTDFDNHQKKKLTVGNNLHSWFMLNSCLILVLTKVQKTYCVKSGYFMLKSPETLNPPIPKLLICNYRSAQRAHYNYQSVQDQLPIIFHWLNLFLCPTLRL